MKYLLCFLLLPVMALAQQPAENTYKSSLAEFYSNANAVRINLPSIPNKNIVIGDTLYIINDTLISGAWSFYGTVVALDTGKILMQNATVTLPGDLVVFGDDARIDIINSTVNQPQQYFYQRSVVCTGHGVFHVENSTLNYNGLSHNMVIAGNGVVELFDVTTQGFRTCGLTNKAMIDINGINQAGEFIIDDSADVRIKNAATVLLWHCFHGGTVINHSFPDGDTLASYNFNSSTPGVSGIDYQIDIDTCTEVMWGLMPDKNSDVTISNSTLRTIGLWFTGHDTLQISGLVNQSTYVNQTMNIPDRNLTLQACSVRTWSLYMFDTVKVDVTSCIVGEIGTFGYSNVTTTTVMVDGSGGYFFANDHSICFAGYTTTSSSVRSQRNGIMVYASGSVLNGTLEATEESILIVVQSALPQDPTYYADGCAWFAMMDGPYSTYYGQTYPITGSAWIDKDPGSPLMDFGEYQLFYSIDQGISWTAIDSAQTLEKRHEWLGNFNTALLPSDGACLLKLTLKDNQAAPISVDAVIQLNVLPAYLNISESEKSLSVYPNPASDVLFVEFPETGIYNLTMVSTDGKVVFSQKNIHGQSTSIDVSTIDAGIYYIEAIGDKVFRHAIVVE